MRQTIVQAPGMASRLISFRVDDELASRLDADMAQMKRRADLDGYEVSEPEYFRMLFRQALADREAKPKKRGKK